MKKTLYVKIALLFILLTTAVLIWGNKLNSSAQALTGFPDFTFDKIVLDPANLSYNPTGEIIFPSIFRAADHFSIVLKKE